jgi:hypothetical protein
MHFTALNGTIIYEKWIGRDVEGCVRGPVEEFVKGLSTERPGFESDRTSKGSSASHPVESAGCFRGRMWPEREADDSGKPGVCKRCIFTILSLFSLCATKLITDFERG